MADLKLVGAVAIKVRPTSDGFREEAERQVKKEARDLKAEVELNAKLQGEEAKKDSKKLKKELDDQTITWNVKLDHDSVRAAQKKFDSMLDPTAEIKFKLGDEKSIKEAQAKLEEMAKKAKVKITYSEDEKGFQEVLNKINQIRRQKLEKTIHFGTSDEELDKLEKEMKSKLAKAAGDKLEIKGESRIKIQYDENRESLEETLAFIDRELAKFKDQTFYVSPDKESLLAARAAVKEVIDNLPVTFEYEMNRSSLEKTIKEIDAQLELVRPKLKIESTLDEASLLAARAEAVAALDSIQETIKISYNLNRTSLEKAISEINSAIDSIHKAEIEVGLNEFELAWVKADLEAAAAKIPVEFEYDRNVEGLKKAIAEIDAQLSKHAKVKIEATLDPLNLAFAKAKLEEELSHQTVQFEYEENLESLKAARAKIRSLMSIDTKLHIDAEMNDESLAEALAKVEAMIKAATPEAKVPVKPEIKHPEYLKVVTALALLTKSQTVDIFVKLNNASILTAAAKLVGLRAAAKWTEAFARSLGTLDRNLPIVAAAVVGLNTLTSGILTLTAGAFSLGNGLGEVVRMAGLLGPAMILGFAAAKTVFTGVFKDFGAAVNGDKDAIKKLTASGKAAAANMRTIFQEMRETISKNFWDEAGDSMLRFTETALPQVRDGMAKTAVSLAHVFNSVVDSASTFAKQDGFSVFFTNLNRGFDNVARGMAPFMSAFLNLAALGSTIFPRMGSAFDVMSQKFDGWVKGLAMDGTFNRWIDQGVQGIKDLWGAGVSLVGVWNNIGQAAQGAGALTLHSFSQAMAKLEEATSTYRFQTNLQNIFRGAREASDQFHEALGKLGPAMDIFSTTVHNALANSGAALAAFIGVLGDVLSSTNLDKGLTAFLSGVKTMFVELRPAAAPISEIFKTFGEIMGQVATDSGPLFRNLFGQLANVLTAAWQALEPFLPALIQVGTTIIQTVGPALESAASTLIPAFAEGVVKLGDGLIPVIKNLADFAGGIVGMVSDAPIGVVVGITTSVLALSGAFQFAATVLPIVNAALKIFGTTAALTGIQMQLAIPVVGILLAALSGLAIGGVAALASAQKSGTPYANEFATALREDRDAAEEAGKAVSDFGTTIGDATKKMAIKKLMDTGAYEAAQKLGIGTSELTKAVLEGGPAFDNIKAKLSGVTGAYSDASAEAIAAASSQDIYGSSVKGPTKAMSEQNDAAKLLGGVMDDVTGSIDGATHANAVEAEAQKAAGIQTENHAKQVDFLAEALKKIPSHVGEAAAASRVLTDSFSSSAAKIDAMRKTFDILLGKDAKQSAAETLGEYIKGFNDLKESVAPLAGKMQELGDSVYGDNGFLNVAGGNKAVMQVNQALVDEVNNVWVGAKAAYDAAIKQGFNAQGAFEKAQQFIADHKGDYNALAEASGVSAEKVQGQWDAVFDHEWVLKVSLEGATEAATRAQEMITALKGQFDGQKFTAWLDANPDMAMLAIQDPVAAATAYVNSTWRAALEANPDPAQNTLKGLKGLTEKDWNNGNFQAILTAAQTIPGLPEALEQIRNGASNSGQLWQAIIYAVTNGVSIAQAQAQLDALAANRTVYIDAVLRRSDPALEDLNGAASGNGRMGTIAHGGFFRQMRAVQDLFSGKFQAGRPTFYANGGIERHVAQIAKGGPIRIWAEPETQGEAYIPLAASKRPRSVAILNQVAKEFGYTLTRNSQQFSAGGLEGHATPTTNNTASVSIGTLYTTDPDEAVRKIRTSQVDALAVAGITLNGA